MRFVASLCFILVLSLGARAQLVSGERIPVGTDDGRGPLAPHAITSEPMGIAHITGGDAPDLFVRTTRFGPETGLFLYPWSGRSDDGVPVFKSPKRVTFPFKGDYPPAGHIFEDVDKVVHGVWLQGHEVVHTILDRDRLAFEEKNRIALPKLPHGAGCVTAMPLPNGAYELLLQVGDGVRYRDWKGSTRDPEYDPYDGRGIWRGGLPYVSLWAVSLPEGLEGPATNARRVSKSDREVRMQFGRITTLELTGGAVPDVLTGSHFGGLHFYANVSDDGLELGDRKRASAGGKSIRHPVIHPTPVSFPNARTGDRKEVIVGGEGGLYWYGSALLLVGNSSPILEEPVPVLEENAKLYAGTLAVPNVVDWDGDGDQDIVAGNSAGFILFFENVGDNAAPRFAPGIRMGAGGEVIHVQPGYRMDIQGPGEARWGYVCPTVVDWNGDGKLDIVMSDSTAQHTIFFNVEKERTSSIFFDPVRERWKLLPELAAGVPLYYDGLEMFGTWRVQPGAAALAGRMAYVALDEDDQFHLYWQEDPQNVTDGGKLTLEDGSPIGANYLMGGGTGRLKIRLYDWDRDGATDLIVGTPRHASVPNPEKGLPQSLGHPGSAVLYLKNVGSDEAPVFAWPKLFAFRGEPLFFGQHACGAAPADFGDPAGPGLIIGTEAGRLWYYAREDLSVMAPKKETYPKVH